MAFRLKALVGPESTIQSAASELKHASVVPLREGMAMIPLTDALLRELWELDAASGAVPYEPQKGIPWIGFFELSPALVAWTRKASQNGAVAFIEAFGVNDDWGGQSAVVWREGNIVWGPEDKFGTISQALRLLGVSAAPDEDEFHAVGLGQYVETMESVTRGSMEIRGHEWAIVSALHRSKLVSQKVGLKIRSSLKRLSKDSRNGAEIQVRTVRGVALLELAGSCLVLPNCNVADQVKRLVAAGQKRILIDLTHVEGICDATGLGNLFRAHMTCREAGGELKLLNPPEKIRDVLVVTKASTVLAIYYDEAEALASFESQDPGAHRES